jgi:hypothetical protein
MPACLPRFPAFLVNLLAAIAAVIVERLALILILGKAFYGNLFDPRTVYVMQPDMVLAQCQQQEPIAAVCDGPPARLRRALEDS